jgi:hypothetical protein
LQVPLPSLILLTEKRDVRLSEAVIGQAYLQNLRLPFGAKARVIPAAH